jgi:hypothetical protein
MYYYLSIKSLFSSICNKGEVNKSSNQKCYSCNSSENIKFYAFQFSCLNCYLRDKEDFLALEKRKTIIISEMDKITEKIFLGNSDSGRDKNLLTKNQITHILIVGTFLFPFYPNDFNYKILEIEDRDDEDIISHFKEAFQFIDNALLNNRNGKILIHCYAGKSRSASFVIGYLMYKHKQPYGKNIFLREKQA